MWPITNVDEGRGRGKQTDKVEFGEVSVAVKDSLPTCRVVMYCLRSHGIHRVSSKDAL